MRRGTRAALVVLIAIGTLGATVGIANAEPAGCSGWRHEGDWILRNKALDGGIWDAVYATWESVDSEAGCW